MKVSELIAELSKHDQDAIVLVSGYESGADEVDEVIATRAVKNKHKSYHTWAGEYREGNEVRKNEDAVPALILPRKSC